MAILDRVGGFGRWLGRGARIAASRFPAAAAAIVAIAVLSNLAVENATGLDESDLAWLIAALFSGAAASVCAALVAESRNASAVATQGASVVAGVAVGLAVWFGNALGIFAPAFIAGLIILVPIAPFAPRAGRADLAFWSFTLWSLTGSALAFVSVLLFVLGVSAILEMVRFLLEVGLSSDAYEHIFVTAFTLVGPLFALGQIPRLSDHEDVVVTNDRLLVGVRVLFDWVATPLALATALVLHLYAAKIALQGALPNNEIGWIVTFYAFLLLGLRMAIAPYVPLGAWATRFLARFWWALLIVPLALLAVAVSLRVGAEGWTAERYYLALGGLAAGAAILLQAVPRLRGSIVAIGLVPALLLLLSSAGPLGVEAVVARSQSGIIVERFAEDGRLMAGSRLAPEAAEEFRSRLRALDEVGGLDALAGYADTPELAAALDRSSWTSEDDALKSLTDALGLGYGGPIMPADLTLSASIPAVIDTSGFDRLAISLYATPVDPAPRPTTGDPPQVAREPVLLSLDTTDLVVRIGAAADRFDLGAALRNLPDAAFSGMDALTVEIAGRGGRRQLRLIITYLTMPADRRAVHQLTATVLYRAGEWR
ncbi:DUF4153 domain-containing protein [Antarcticirhabdus aurantiaca]|uniref:DUF4153 domain-containing protein n=1 Tax=Antarcticirhabdus aurantiaca TaxID=2606717 RepID=A0ACD4NWK0_9HYPH|nr:DUF4153 domain-containing protein [Antarcticirhabdus aurantiaca]WAJ31118.1 DUF4153 domain-containing protein [Jeongeuplla avenae]